MEKRYRSKACTRIIRDQFNMQVFLYYVIRGGVTIRINTVGNYWRQAIIGGRRLLEVGDY